MISNYLFVALLAVMWLATFVYPLKAKPHRRFSRALAFLRFSSVWWIFGMAYRLLGSLIPQFALPAFLDGVFIHTLALPIRLGEATEHVRSRALGLPYDLAMTMIFGLFWAFLGSAVALTALAVLRQRMTRKQRTKEVETDVG